MVKSPSQQGRLTEEVADATQMLFHSTYLSGFTTCYIAAMTDDTVVTPTSTDGDVERTRGDLAARFWSKVAIGLPDECWEWTRSRRNVEGEDYGHFKWTPPGWDHDTVMSAHRVAFYLTNGHLPVVGCHTCDNPPCCNPAHIYDGTHATNGADKAVRGRGRGKSDQRGESNDSAVLTDEIVLEARRRARGGQGITDVAKALGVPRPALNYAVLGKTWAHLDTIEAPVVVGQGKGRGKLTHEQIAEVIALQGQLSAREVGERYGITDIAVKYHWRKHPLTSSQ